MSKPWIVLEFYNNCEQKIRIEPTSEMDAIQLNVGEADDKQVYKRFYLNPTELPVLIEKLQKMMNYVTKK